MSNAVGKYPVKKNGGITFLNFFAKQPKLPFHAKVTSMPFVSTHSYQEKSGKNLIIQECVLDEPNKIGYTNVL